MSRFIQALVRVQQHSCSPDSTASSTKSSFCRHSIHLNAAMPDAAASAAATAAPRQQWKGSSAWQSMPELEAAPGDAASLASSNGTYAAGLEEPAPKPPQPRASSAAAREELLTPLQRVDSLEQLEASCRSMAGILQQDSAAAEQHAQQHTTEPAAVAGESTAASSSPGAPLADARQLPGDSGTTELQRRHDKSDSSAVGDAGETVLNSGEAGQLGGSRRGTDASMTAENTWLRQELSHLRSEHVATRIQ